MFRHLLVCVSIVALAWGSAWAPHQHVHLDDDVRHAHVTAHEHGHHHERPSSNPPQDEHEPGQVLSGGQFLSPAPGTLALPGAVDLSPEALTEPPVRLIGAVDRLRPTAHSPPGRNRLAPRAPPASPL